MQLSQKHPKPGKIEPFSYYLEILAHTHMGAPKYSVTS